MKNQWTYIYTSLPQSALLQGVLIRLVNGNILCINSVCSKKEESNLRMNIFYARLLFHGYQSNFLNPVFTKGITGARAFIKHGSVGRCTSDQDKDTHFCVFFHLTYNPRDSSSRDLQWQRCQHLLHPPWEPPLWRLKNKPKIPIGINLVCVPYTRPQKLGDIFMYRKVNRLNGALVSSYM